MIYQINYFPLKTKQEPLYLNSACLEHGNKTLEKKHLKKKLKEQSILSR